MENLKQMIENILCLLLWGFVMFVITPVVLYFAVAFAVFLTNDPLNIIK